MFCSRIWICLIFDEVCIDSVISVNVYCTKHIVNKDLTCMTGHHLTSIPERLAGTEQLSSPPGWEQRWCRCMRWCSKRRQSNLWDSFLLGLVWCSDSLSGGSPVCPSSWALKASQWRTLSVPLSHACHTAPYGRHLQGWARRESAKISAISSAGTRGDVSFNWGYDRLKKINYLGP